MPRARAAPRHHLRPRSPRGALAPPNTCTLAPPLPVRSLSPCPGKPTARCPLLRWWWWSGLKPHSWSLPPPPSPYRHHQPHPTAFHPRRGDPARPVPVGPKSAAPLPSDTPPPRRGPHGCSGLRGAAAAASAPPARGGARLPAHLNARRVVWRPWEASLRAPAPRRCCGGGAASFPRGCSREQACPHCTPPSTCTQVPCNPSTAPPSSGAAPRSSATLRTARSVQHSTRRFRLCRPLSPSAALLGARRAGLRFMARRRALPRKPTRMPGVRCAPGARICHGMRPCPFAEPRASGCRSLRCPYPCAPRHPEIAGARLLPDPHCTAM